MKNHILDANGKILGRLASRAALLLVGKGKRGYAPNRDDGDIVLVKNVALLRISGRKLEQNEYKRFSGYPGGLKRVKWGKLMAENPKKLFRLAVLRMLPKNRLQRQRINRLIIE